MKHIFITGIIIFCSILQLNAQSDFRDGYIVKSTHDTIYGLIDYRGYKANTKYCTFKNDLNSEEQSFTPTEILGYRFLNSKYYVSKTITIGDEAEQFFLEYLINGIVDMYYYRDNSGEHYMVDDGSGSLYELKNEEIEIVKDNTRYVKESKEYIGILKAIFRESPSVAKKVELIDLNHKSLIKITQDYHNEVCSGEACIIYEKKLPKNTRSFGMVVGMNWMSVSQKGEFSDEFYYLRNSQFGAKLYPSIGMYFKVNMPFINERLYFQYEGTYSRSNLTASSTYFDPVYDMSHENDLRLTQNTFNNLGVIKYESPKGTIRPTFQIGGFANYFFSTDYERNHDVQYSWGGTYYTNQTNESPFGKFDYGLTLGAGVVLEAFNQKEISVDLKYQRGFGFLRHLNLNYFSLHVGLPIGK